MNVPGPIREIQENYDRSTWWKGRFAHRVLGPIQDRIHESSFRVMDEEWDVLVVLDACREDLFREVVDTSGYDAYETRTSAGSATDEWSHKNFSGQALTDTVYVTGNPVVSRSVQTPFHAFVEVWRDGFDEELGTVPPDPVTEAAIDARERYPEKRLIVHYLQPHYPFIGYPDLRFATFGNTEEIETAAANPGADDVWEALDLGLVDRETVWKAYADNLERAMDSIENLVDACDGRVVITSDHGNLLGERVSPLRVPLYGHPPYVHHPALRTVPWAVIDGDTQRSDRAVDTDVEEQLESLGYA